MFRIISLVFVLVLAPQSIVWASDKAKELDIASAKSLYDKGVLFIDARKDTSFKRAHIKGAHSLPVFGGNFKEENLLQIVAKDQPVVFYCNCPPSCNISPAAANVAIKKYGYQDVYYFKAAIDGWTEAGYPLVKAQ
jgi:rhodanese-related sulfurtransferase